MSYLQAMIDKKLEKDQLPRGLQLKIENLEKAVEKISEYENQEDLDDEDKENLENLIIGAKELEKNIEKSILKFDPEVYKKKLEIMMGVRAKRKKGNDSVKSELKKAESEPEPEAEPEPEPEPEVVVEQEIEKLKRTAQILPEELEDEVCEDCLDDFHNGQLTMEDIRSEKEQDEEFEKVSNAKPRKMSQSLILMGIGAFILTWGAVNFFRERRG